MFAANEAEMQSGRRRGRRFRGAVVIPRGCVFPSAGSRSVSNGGTGRRHFHRRFRRELDFVSRLSDSDAGADDAGADGAIERRRHVSIQRRSEKGEDESAGAGQNLVVGAPPDV